MSARDHLRSLRGPIFDPETGQPFTDEQERARKVLLEARCPGCGDTKLFALDAEKAVAWQRGDLIQRVFPELSDDDRERLMSGTCPTCWDAMWSEED